MFSNYLLSEELIDAQLVLPALAIGPGEDETMAEPGAFGKTVRCHRKTRTRVSCWQQGCQEAMGLLLFLT